MLTGKPRVELCEEGTKVAKGSFHEADSEFAELDNT